MAQEQVKDEAEEQKTETEESRSGSESKKGKPPAVKKKTIRRSDEGKSESAQSGSVGKIPPVAAPKPKKDGEASGKKPPTVASKPKRPTVKSPPKTPPKSPPKSPEKVAPVESIAEVS